MKYFSPFILISILFSCNNKSEKLETSNLIEWSVVSEFTIDNQDILLNYGFTSDFYSDNQTNYIIGLNNYYNRIEIVDIIKRKLVRKIHLNTDEFKIHELKIDDFYIHNLDSIYLYSHENQKIVLIDEYGKFKKVINLNEAIESFQSKDFLQVSMTSRRNIYFNSINNQIILRSVPPFNWYTDKEFYDKPFLVEYDLGSNKFTSIFGRFPIEMSKGNEFFSPDYQLSYYINSGKNTYVVSNRREHYLYEFELNSNNLLNKVSAKSNYLDEFELIPRKFEMQKILNTLIKDGNYVNFLYNKYKRQYYRIVTHKQNLVNPNTGKLNHPINNRNFSVLVFDESMKLLGESIFDNTEFNYMSLTPVKEGLLVTYTDKNDENIKHFKTIDFLF